MLDLQSQKKGYIGGRPLAILQEKVKAILNVAVCRMFQVSSQC